QYEGRVPTDPDLLRFYQDSAYQFGQMLETAGDKEGAVKAYGRVLTTNPDKNISRRIMAKQAELNVQIASTAAMDQRDKLLSDAKKLCETIQWGGLDIWFGQSIITLAHIQMVKDDRAGAQKVIQSNLDILKEIDKFIQEQNLPLSESPMAGARFLLGDSAGAIADYTEAIRINPKKGCLYSCRAGAYLKNGEKAKGEEDEGPTMPPSSGSPILCRVRVPQGWREAPGRVRQNLLWENDTSGCLDLDIAEAGVFDLAKWDAHWGSEVEGDPFPENINASYAWRDGVMFWRKRHTGEVVMAEATDLGRQAVIGGEGSVWDGFRLNPIRDEMVTWRENGELVFWNAQFPEATPLVQVRVNTDETPHRLEMVQP
ncbi:MAG: hypothetical protein HGB17_16100, partial [Syntrophobacteraceae bacterium]|nr:hypothetical protein [Syntrophobacteraceae bacterium]